MIIACPACGSRYRIDPTGTTKAVGTAMCPQCGHRFEVVLSPPSPNATPPASADTPVPAGKPTVLVVDDSKFFRDLVADVLKPLGLQFLLAADGAEALAIIRRARPALVVLDLNLPGMSGYDLLREVRGDDALAGIRLLAMSGVYRSEVDAAQVLAAGADGFIGKSFHPEQLQFRVQQLLAGRS